MTSPTADEIAVSHRGFDGGGYTNWMKMRAETGGAIDLAAREHRVIVHRWLNRWGCRLPYGRDGNETGTVVALDVWWQNQQQQLEPVIGTGLAAITDNEIDIAADAFDELARSPASVRRRIGPTAASKVMMALSPRTFPAWDATIVKVCYDNARRDAYREHLALTRGWAQELGDGVTDLVDDNAGITVAKLLDEWLYTHHTRTGR